MKGTCECPEPTPHPCLGVAVYRIAREGEPLRLCTRCTLSGDVFVARLYTEDDIPRLAAMDRAEHPSDPIAQLVDILMDSLGGAPELLRQGLKLPLEGH